MIRMIVCMIVAVGMIVLIRVLYGRAWSYDRGRVRDRVCVPPLS